MRAPFIVALLLATYDRPHQYPIGIETVIVNGAVTIDRGTHTGAHAGRALFHGRKSGAVKD